MSMQRLSQIADQYEQLVKDDALVWLPVDKMVLDPTVVVYLETILDPSGLHYSIADQQLDRTVLFKVEHAVVKYLHHDPVTQQHMWAGEGFAEALPNHLVLLELAKCKPRQLMDGIFKLLRRAPYG